MRLDNLFALRLTQLPFQRPLKSKSPRIRWVTKSKRQPHRCVTLRGRLVVKIRRRVQETSGIGL